MPDQPMNLIQKLAKIRAISDVVAKEKRGYNYSYADITTILANITSGMKKYGVSLIPAIIPESATVEQNTIVNTKFDKTGKPYDQTSTEMIVTAEMNFRWINDDNPNDYLDVRWFITGSQADPSQAFGSALTYCTRYFLTNYFQIAQPDNDVDAYRSKQKAAEASEDRAVADGIIAEFDVMLRKFLADHADKTEEVKKFISRFAKNADYSKIKEPALAAKLLDDFKHKYIEETKGE